jgi:hypothetical protein
MAKSPLGKLKPAAIGMTELPRPAPEILEGFRALGDLTGTTSDALDDCGVCFVPHARATEVLGVAQRLAAGEARRLQALAEGIPLSEYVKFPR